MRPLVDVEQITGYECYGCGHRQADPTPPVCPACGAEMYHIGRPRDL